MRLPEGILDRLSRLVARDDAAVGLLIEDRYRVLSRLGRGGMGEVLRARDARLGRDVAMKILAPELSTPEWTERFKAEARTMSRIDHPGVVPIHDLGRFPDGRIFYTMKLVEGRTFDELVRAREDRRKLLRILVQVASIVQQAHERGVVHRDLKPANLMVGRNEQVYVLDWGIARVVDEIRVAGGEGIVAGVGLTSTGTVLGTIEYMPPEQARGDLAAIDARSDVYALGAILHDALVGSPPITGPRTTMLLERAAAGRIVSPRDRDPSIPADLEAICRKATAPAPADRYPTAREFGEELRRWLEGDAVAARPSALYRLRKFAVKRRAILGVAAAGLLAVAILLPQWIAQRSETARQLAARAEEKAASGRREGAIKELGALWSSIVTTREWIRQPFRDPAEIRREMAARTDAVSGFILRHPRLPEGYYVRARARHYAGAVREAEKDLEEALRIEPAFAPAWTLLARSTLERGYSLSLRQNPAGSDELFQQADRALRRASEGSSAIEKWGLPRTAEDDVNENVVRATHAYYVKRETEPAIALVRGWQEKAPSEEYARLLGLWHPDSAERARWLDRAIEIAPHWAPVRYDRGCRRADAGDPKGAIEDLDRALFLDPGLEWAHLTRANVRFHSGDRKGSFADFDRAVELWPANPEVHLERGNARFQESDFEGAVADLSRSIELDPLTTRAWIHRGRTRMFQERPDDALRDLTHAIELDEAYETSLKDRPAAGRTIERTTHLGLAYNNRGDVRMKQKDFPAAIADYTRAIAAAPLVTEGYLDRAEAKAALNDLEGALADVDRAIQMIPDSDLAHFNRGVIRERQGNAAAAIADYTRAIELNPRAAKALVNRGALRTDRKEYAAAIEDFTRATELYPRSPRPYFNRGIARQESGDLGGAIEDYTATVERDPKHDRAWFARAGAHQKRREWAKAAADYSKVLELVPRHVQALAERGNVKGAMGDPEGAIADLTRALELAPPDWPARAAVVRMIEDARRGKQP